MLEVMKRRRPISLETIFGREMLQKIDAAETVPQKIKEIENYLLESKDSNKTYQVNLVHEVVCNIDTYLEGKITLKQLSREYFVSSKSLSRYFIHCTGLTPKYVFTALRFRRALKNYLANPTEFDLSEYGFFDHSHFYRDIKRFTGFYPYQILSNLAGTLCLDAPPPKNLTV
jgi:AraC-like DNA-binding protein